MDYLKTDDGRTRGPIVSLCHGGRLFQLLVEHLTLDSQREKKEREPIPRPHSHAVYHIVLYRSGENRFNLNGGMPSCRPGTLAASSPGDSHDFGPLDKGRLSYAELSFTLEDEAKLHLELPFPEMLSLLCGARLPSFCAVFELDQMKAACILGALEGLLSGLRSEDAPLGRLNSTEALFRIFGVIAAAAGSASPEGTEHEDASLRKVKRFMELNLQRRLALEELASLAGLSEAHLCRKFKSAYGKPPIETLVCMRVEAAKSLLRASSLSCKEISAKTGFSDPMFFSKMFKRSTGLTPASYRATHAS